ncbi:unnamed protein product [Hydatigera taeniaeformis]|uniref:WD_REPEATS_REGION domain-containing protein n=1 Tax=Hydatigena taeniaeformis TaxID=6205 RepID=A0A0R3X7M8_HYDTA|nr:unnamed protein product [Hydatigera taeniaeformis]
MHSSFSRTLHEIRSGDGSLVNALSNSRNMKINAAPFLLETSLPNLPNQTYDNSLLPSVFYRRPSNLDCDGDRCVGHLPLRILRFIPNRRAMDMDRAQFYLTQAIAVSDPSSLPKPGDRILEFSRKRPSVPGQESAVHEISKPKKSVRYIPKVSFLFIGLFGPKYIKLVGIASKCIARFNRTVFSIISKFQRPEHVLDAPDLLNDYYLNLIDWSKQNSIAIALDRDVYLYNACGGGVRLIMSAGLNEEYITSVKFSPHDGNVLAVGTSMGRLQLWDVEHTALQRTMLGDEGDPARIPALAWRDHVVTSGSRTGEIRHHDIRIAQHLIGYSDEHTQEVCGLQWSPDDRFLASGGNDNVVCIYSADEAFKLSGGRPNHVLNEHVAAVKAVAWCPWKPTLLATGGGTRDHHLRFWNVYSGACLRAVDVQSQVSGIVWSEEFRELITGHGSGSLCIWKYPNIQKVKEFTGKFNCAKTGIASYLFASLIVECKWQSQPLSRLTSLFSDHQDRVLSIVASPDKEMVASCSGDETLRIWHCFKVDKAKKRLEEQKNASIFAFPRPMR